MDNEALSKSLLDQLPMFVLDVLQHDIAEQKSSVLRLLNNDSCIGWREFWPRDFTESDVNLALSRLIQEGLVVVYRQHPDSGELVPAKVRDMPHHSSECWFGRTSAGIRAWDAWEPPSFEGG